MKNRKLAVRAAVSVTAVIVAAVSCTPGWDVWALDRIANAGAVDWNRPFDPRTVELVCKRNLLQAVIDAAGTPETITVLSDIPMTSSGNITIPSGKYIRLVSGSGRRVRKRAAGNTASLIRVNGELTLENISVDGGAVWTGGTAAPPSPAFGAANSGAGARFTLQTRSSLSAARRRSSRWARTR